MCRDKLSKLEGLLGPEGNAEVRELAARLEGKEEGIKVLEAKLKSQDLVRDTAEVEIGCGGTDYCIDVRLRICCTEKSIVYQSRGRHWTSRVIRKSSISCIWKRRFND